MIGLRDPTKSFPVSTDVGVLKWRFQSQDESEIPLTSKILLLRTMCSKLINLNFFFIQVNCWPSETKNGCEVSIEYELQKGHLELNNVVIAIPIP
jgi:hypothetical protein